MYAWQSIQETLDYIETHYGEEIEIKELSSIAHLSMFYYQRLFNRLVGKSVYEYIRLRRLAKASTQLKESKKRILDIALACGFNSHSSFTKAFKEVYGITPEHYRDTNLHLDHFLKPDLVLQYTMVDEGVPLICNQMVLEIKRDIVEKEVLFIGKSTQSLVAEISQPKVNTLVNQWDAMHQDMEYINSQTTTGVEVDILLPSNNPEYFECFTGIQADREINNYDSWIMPKGNYVVCSYEAETFEQLVDEALYKASQYLFDVWLVKHELKTDMFIVQKYYNPNQDNCFIEVWVKII